MEKPVTIQELRQLLDAISSLGKYADWNTLVFQFVTKEEENHIMLKNAENLDLDDQDLLNGIRGSSKLDSSAYGELPTQNYEEDIIKPMLPSISKVRKWKTNIVETTFEDIGDCYGLLEKTEDNYTKMALLGDSTDNPSDFGWIKNCSTTLALEKPVDLDLFLNRREIMDGGWGIQECFRAVRELNHGYSTSGVDEKLQTGEIMFRLSFVERSEFIRMVRFQGHIINKMTSNEVISRGVFPLERDRGGRNKIHTSEVNFRWRKGKGLDVIVPLSGMNYFNDFWRTSTRSSLIADGSGNESIYCASNNFFVEQKHVPLANMRSMRHFSNVARYGLTRIVDGRGRLWRELNIAINRGPGVVCTETDEVNSSLHLHYPTDWIESKSITVGRYQEPLSGTWYCEIRMNGSLHQDIQKVFADYAGGSIPVYMSVLCTSRKLLSKLTSDRHRRWKRSTTHLRTISNKGLHFTTCGNAMGYFWSSYPFYIGRQRCDSTKTDMGNMLRRLRYYKDKYNGFK